MRWRDVNRAIRRNQAYTGSPEKDPSAFNIQGLLFNLQPYHYSFRSLGFWAILNPTVTPTTFPSLRGEK